VAQTLYGPWQLQVAFGQTHAEERFTISGSDAADGVYDSRPLSVGISTVPALVTGTRGGPGIMRRAPDPGALGTMGAKCRPLRLAFSVPAGCLQSLGELG
jgi:hypothetical protein